jgi:hypothetical protein
MPNLGVGAGGGAIVIAAPAERATLAATMLSNQQDWDQLFETRAGNPTFEHKVLRSGRAEAPADHFRATQIFGCDSAGCLSSRREMRASQAEDGAGRAEILPECHAI